MRERLPIGNHSWSFCNLTGRNAACAYADTTTSTTLIDDLYRLEVREPPASCLVVRVANVVPGSWTLPTHIANSSHITFSYRSDRGFAGIDHLITTGITFRTRRVSYNDFG